MGVRNYQSLKGNNIYNRFDVNFGTICAASHHSLTCTIHQVSAQTNENCRGNSPATNLGNSNFKGLTNCQSLPSKRYKLLQIIFSLSIKFQLNRMKIVGIILKEKMWMDVQKDGRKDGMQNTMSPRSSLKRQDNKERLL